MEKFIPYEKLSKKEKRKIDLARRQTWGELNPVTRKPVNSKAYNRNKARNWKRDYHELVPGFLILLRALVADVPFSQFPRSPQRFPENHGLPRLG